jgi:hypothetical protein
MKQQAVQEDYSKLRDLVLYNKVAPKIVEAVNTRPDAKEIWQRTYEKIRSIVPLINSNNFSEAYKLYKAMTLDLQALVGV